MHRPLEPPPGYEHFHTKEAVFPGLRHKGKKIENWAQFKQSLCGAWRLYKHNYYPDPEITKIEESMDLVDQKMRERAMTKFLKKGEAFANKGIDTAQEVASDVAEEIRDKRPVAERILRDRVAVLREAMHEFAEGYYEAASGKRTLWGEVPYDEDLVREDNRPLRYEAESGAE